MLIEFPIFRALVHFPKFSILPVVLKLKTIIEKANLTVFVTTLNLDCESPLLAGLIKIISKLCF